MRRIAAVALAAGTLTAGIGAVAVPANAAGDATAFKASGGSAVVAPEVGAAAKPKPKKWKTKNSFPRVAAWGKYTRGPKRVFGPANLSDGGRDGWQACVRFKVTNKKGKRIAPFFIGCVVNKRTGGPADTKTTVKGSFNLPRGAHFYVQEVRRSMSSGKVKYGAWKKLY